jgi:uncharacterized protein (TIGR02271 family)
MLTEQEAHDVIGHDAYAADGEKIGRVGQLYFDDQTGQPEVVTVNTGLFGTNESFVPLSEATTAKGALRVPYTKEEVKGAPNVSVGDGHLDEAQEEELYAYYGLGYSQGDADASTTGFEPRGRDVSGPTTDDAMTVSEERVRVGTRSQEAGRVRLRKYVVTEQETHTVPVRKEKAVLEREPITDANVGRATDGPAISEEEHELTLHEERAVVEKTVEPVERVRLGSETTTEEQAVTEQVRKERVEAEGDLEEPI